jgi:hypothetical protein
MQILSQKKIVSSRKKFDLISLLPYFPQYTVSESSTIIAWLKGGKIKTQGEKFHIFSPSWIFVLFSLTIKIIFGHREKNTILCPLLPAFFPKFPIIL